MRDDLLAVARIDQPDEGDRLGGTPRVSLDTARARASFMTLSKPRTFKSSMKINRTPACRAKS
ncbi:MAG TPA: hypothetical protein VIN77_01745 [Aurantimonas sp.]